jgi:hypothetical protein
MTDRKPLENPRYVYRHEAEDRGHGIVAIYSYGPAAEHTKLVREAAQVMKTEYGVSGAVSSGGISGWLSEAPGGSPDTRVCETQTIFLSSARLPRDYTCRVCGTATTLEVSESDLADWRGGMFIQNALPYLNADERELVKTGTCGPCFDLMFPEEDDE